MRQMSLCPPSNAREASSPHARKVGIGAGGRNLGLSRRCGQQHNVDSMAVQEHGAYSAFVEGAEARDAGLHSIRRLAPWGSEITVSPARDRRRLKVAVLRERGKPRNEFENARRGHP